MGREKRGHNLRIGAEAQVNYFELDISGMSVLREVL